MFSRQNIQEWDYIQFVHILLLECETIISYVNIISFVRAMSVSIIFSFLAGSYLENKQPLLVTGVQVVITDTNPKVQYVYFVVRIY